VSDFQADPLQAKAQRLGFCCWAGATAHPRPCPNHPRPDRPLRDAENVLPAMVEHPPIYMTRLTFRGGLPANALSHRIQSVACYLGLLFAVMLIGFGLTPGWGGAAVLSAVGAGIAVLFTQVNVERVEMDEESDDE